MSAGQIVLVVVLMVVSGAIGVVVGLLLAGLPHYDAETGGSPPVAHAAEPVMPPVPTPRKESRGKRK